MTLTSSTRGRSKGLVLTAMIFAVAMTFIDQTIVSIAAPTVQHDLGLSSGGMQWAINAYLLALATLFAFGGRLADTVGHRTMVIIGVIIFVASSALCGATPRGAAAEAWIVTFRAVQGAGGAIMFPAAIAIVVATFDLQSRGRALALFFGIAGGLTAIGPIAGGYLIQWTWRAIFWINVPVALIALALIAVSKPVTEHRPAPMDFRGLALIVGGVGLSVFGFQQSALWGWGNAAIEVCIAIGVLLLVVFFAVERRKSWRWPLSWRCAASNAASSGTSRRALPASVNGQSRNLASGRPAGKGICHGSRVSSAICHSGSSYQMRGKADRWKPQRRRCTA